MKTLSVQISDNLYDRAERKATELGSSLQREVVGLIERFGASHEDATLVAARASMQELFRSVKGFRDTPKISREDLYDRESLR